MGNATVSLVRRLLARRRLRAVILVFFLISNWSVAAAENVASGGGPTSWPDFRGPLKNGIAAMPGTEVGLPLQWSETENVKWKTEIPFRGWSTPVILNGQIWLTTATEEGNDFYAICVDADTGQIRFNEKLFHSDNPEPLGNNVNSYASPSPVIEPGRVYVHFGSYGTACLDTETAKVIWARQDLPCRHYRGPGSSPFLFEDLLILTFDGADMQYLTALEKKTGKTVWKTDRSTEWHDFDETGKVKREGDFRKGFTTPLVVEAVGRLQLLSPGSTTAFAYDPRTGQEIWRARNASHSPAVRPVFGHVGPEAQGDGLAFIATGRDLPELWAIRLDGQGDVTDTHIVWKVNGACVPQESSPILLDGLLYVVSNDGLAACLDAATGQEVWSLRIGGNYDASPVYAEGRVYFFSVQGKTTVLKAGRALEVLATNKLDTGCMASPAVVGKALFVRTKTHLYRIESDAPKN